MMIVQYRAISKMNIGHLRRFQHSFVKPQPLLRELLHVDEPKVFKEAKRLAFDCLRKEKHLDPEPGYGWGSCQVTAATSLIDFNMSMGGEIVDSIVARYLLLVDKEGESPDASQLFEKLKALKLAPIMWVNSNRGKVRGLNSKAQAEKHLKALQQWLRRDMAEKLGIELKDSKEEYVINNPAQAFGKVLDYLKENNSKIGLVIYPGTPNLVEVRSLIGAQYFVPFAYDSTNDKFRLDECNDNLQVFVTDKSAHMSEEAVEVIHIPRLAKPDPEQDFFILHVGLAKRTVRALNEKKRGNIVSHLDLRSFDPLEFMRERFSLLQKPVLDEEELPTLNNPELSLFHFSHMPSYSEYVLSLPNEIDDRPQIMIDAEYSHLRFASYYASVMNLKHHALFIDEIKSDGYSYPYLHKVENGYSYSLARAFEPMANYNEPRFYIQVTKWNPHACMYGTMGAFERIEDRELVIKKAAKFIDSLLMYHRLNFCLQTRRNLNRTGFTVERLNIIKNNINQLVYQPLY